MAAAAFVAAAAAAARPAEFVAVPWSWMTGPPVELARSGALGALPARLGCRFQCHLRSGSLYWPQSGPDPSEYAISAPGVVVVDAAAAVVKHQPALVAKSGQHLEQVVDNNSGQVHSL